MSANKKQSAKERAQKQINCNMTFRLCAAAFVEKSFLLELDLADIQ